MDLNGSALWPAVGPAHNARMGTREELHRLVSSLPDDALPAARTALLQFQAVPASPALEHFRRAQQRVHERVEERIREMAERLADATRADAESFRRRDGR